MRAVDEHGTCRLEPRAVKVLLAQCHVGAVLPVEDQRERVTIADSQYHQGSQPLRIVKHAAYVNAFADQLFADEASHVVGADARQQTSLESKSSGRHGGIRRASADVLGE